MGSGRKFVQSPGSTAYVTEGRLPPGTTAGSTPTHRDHAPMLIGSLEQE